jgi:hypothetical protein
VYSERGINDNNKGVSAGFGSHGNQCPGRDRLHHRGDLPLALFTLAAIYKRATPALLILGTLAGGSQLLDVGIGLFQHDLRKFAGPLFFAVLQFFVVYLLHRSTRITPQTERG